MFQRFQDRVGTAGLIVAVVALVLALGGGAYAASGALTSKQKKEVTKIAQTEAKKFAKAGPAGPEGKQGGAGAAGGKGDAGAAGSNGANGKNVTTTSISVGGLEGHCVEVGGTRFEVEGSGVKNYVCNGAEGATGWAPSLPPGETETGTYAIGKATEAQIGAGSVYEPISFPFPLPEGEGFANGGELKEVQVEYVTPAGSTTAHCKGSTKNPTADEGFMCVYHSLGSGTALPEFSNIEPESHQPEFGAGRTGVILRFNVTATGATDSGTWAVTARK